MTDTTDIDLPRHLDASTAADFLREWNRAAVGVSALRLRWPANASARPCGTALIAALVAWARAGGSTVDGAERLAGEADGVATEAEAAARTAELRQLLDRRGVSGSIARAVAPVVEEVLVNAVQHSRRADTAHVAVTVDADHFEVGVCDAGIGIRQSLVDAGEWHPETDREAILLALGDRVSGGNLGIDNAGLGLPWTVEVSRRTGSSLAIWSGDARWTYGSDGPATVRTEHLAGTWVCLRVPNRPAAGREREIARESRENRGRPTG